MGQSKIISAFETAGKAKKIKLQVQMPADQKFVNLYIDMNSLLHKCYTKRHFRLGTTKALRDWLAGIIFDEVELHVINRKPRKLLFVCYDGVPNLAKFAVQYARRKNSYKEDAKEHKILKEDHSKNGNNNEMTPDDDMIYRIEMTPGTELMKHLSWKLKLNIYKKRKGGDAHWNGFEIIVSDSNMAGEGDHKMVTFANEYVHFNGYEDNMSHGIYTSDSDSVILALLTHQKNFIVYGDDTDTKKSEDEESTAAGKQLLCLMNK